MTYPSPQGPYGPRPGYPAPAWQQRGGSVVDEFIVGNAQIRLTVGGAKFVRGRGFSYYGGTVNGKEVDGGMLVLGDEVEGQWCHAGLTHMDLPR